VIDEGCLGPGIDRAKIHPDAEIRGASYLTGAGTSVAAGAVVRDSRLHDVAVGPGAAVLDSIVRSEGHAHVHRCDAAGRVIVRGADRPVIGAGARVEGCTLIRTSLGERTVVRDSWATDAILGPDNRVLESKLVMMNSAAQVTVKGPTEISEAFLGHGATIDRRGYLEGNFSNLFRKLRFDESAKRLRVVETVELPHLSRYGLNTINSTNSGRLLPLPGGVLHGFGDYEGLWSDRLLSHEQIELGPCCWVAPWTKVVGQSAAAHHDDEELVNDPLMTYMMPFSIAGYGGESTAGLVMPGELSNGIGYKKRRGAWVFTYAPDLVIRMVRRLYAALPDGRKAVADTIVRDAIRTAIEIVKAMAAAHRVDFGADEQRRGWPNWIAGSAALLRAHLENDLWIFTDGEPVEWRLENGRWTHPRFAAIEALAPDALENQVDEETVFAEEGRGVALQPALPTGAINGSGGPAQAAAGAEIAPDAFIGPGCRIAADCRIGSGARLWNAVLENSTVGAGSLVERSVLKDTRVGARNTVRSCRMHGTALGDDSTADYAAVAESHLAAQTTISAFADLAGVRASFGTILGGAFSHTSIDVYLMAMHLAGAVGHLEAIPVAVETEGRQVLVPAIPMIGGGAVVRGSAERPVTMQCAFIGSNALVEEGCHVGFGSFVLGTLGPGEGLLPFTVSLGGGPKYQQIGAVLMNMANVIMTHFINWTYQAVGPRGASAVALMVRRGIEEGLRAVEWEIERRGRKAAEDPNPRFSRYRNLTLYTDDQLRAGLKCYRRALASGAWDLEAREGRVCFTAENGRWTERSGMAFWESSFPARRAT
jgi:carbonic anhydrase/acetyltransferase-like protein (isoleucine patch superfamily)